MLCKTGERRAGVPLLQEVAAGYTDVYGEAHVMTRFFKRWLACTAKGELGWDGFFTCVWKYFLRVYRNPSEKP